MVRSLPIIEAQMDVKPYWCVGTETCPTASGQLRVWARFDGRIVAKSGRRFLLQAGIFLGPFWPEFISSL